MYYYLFVSCLFFCLFFCLIIWRPLAAHEIWSQKKTTWAYETNMYTHIYIYIHCTVFDRYNTGATNLYQHIRWEQVCTWDYFELESTIKSNHVSFCNGARWGLVRLSHCKCVELPLCRRFEEICLRKGDGFVLFSSARGHLPGFLWVFFAEDFFQLQATGYPWIGFWNKLIYGREFS